MALIVPPTDPAVSFDYLDNIETQWGSLFHDAGRKSQRWQCGTSILIENAMASELLRLYADIMSHNNFNAARTIQNLSEFKHGGAIIVALNELFLVGLVWNYRPIVRRECIDDYRAAWKRLAHVPSQQVDADKVHCFLEEVVPMLGVWSLELARGYGSPTMTAAQTGITEAEGELQVRCNEVRLVTRMCEDMAQNPAWDDIYLALMDVKGKPTNPVDLWEKIGARAVWVTIREYDQAVREKHIVDPYTPMALDMLRVYDPETFYQIRR